MERHSYERPRERSTSERAARSAADVAAQQQALGLAVDADDDPIVDDPTVEVPDGAPADGESPTDIWHVPKGVAKQVSDVNGDGRIDGRDIAYAKHGPDHPGRGFKPEHVGGTVEEPATEPVADPGTDGSTDGTAGVATEGGTVGIDGSGLAPDAGDVSGALQAATEAVVAEAVDEVAPDAGEEQATADAPGEGPVGDAV